ncbi:MAG: class I SAM-dependent methyltransferase [Candidatus Binatia bacterium]
MSQAIGAWAYLGKLARWLRGYRPERATLEHWETSYAAGQWERLWDADQLAHYAMVVGYCDLFGATGAILDVGCGDGIVAARLGHRYRRYVGIDVSREAIRRAREARGDAETCFEVGDANTYVPTELFDVVIFNECLYYLDEPSEVVRRYEAALTPQGVVVVSMYGRDNNQHVWTELERLHPAVDAVRVQHASGKVWDVRVYRPSGAGG